VRGTGFARVAAVAALVAGAILVVLVLSGGEDSYEVTAEFENASQLVGSEQVVVGGVPAGKVTEIRLGSDGQALVTFSVDEEFAPLRRGTVATVRSYSISGLANRQVQLTIPPDQTAGEEIEDGGTLSQSETVAEVDIDAVFNALDDRTIGNLKKVIEGLDLSYAGIGKQANRGLRYANPLLSASRRAIGELVRDRQALQELLVDTAAVSGALAQRAPDLAALVQNANRAMGALGRQKGELARAVAALPGFMREFNTTAVNLRATLDDLDPLVEASEPAVEALGPFLVALRRTSERSVPTIADLDALTSTAGPSNDMVELMRALPPLARKAVGDGAIGGGDTDCAGADAGDDDYNDGALDEAACSLENSLEAISFLRAYAPELFGWINDFSTSGTYDANGGIGRIGAVFNTFGLALPVGLPDLTIPDSATDQLDALALGQNTRCPGSLERDPGDGSTPYTEGGTLACDPSEIPVGP
jgi:phospholipid/cholesterol/gamma-HCH transport system substrate-binding protein